MNRILCLCINVALGCLVFAAQGLAQGEYQLEGPSWETGSQSVAAKCNVPLGREQCPSGDCDGAYVFKLSVDAELINSSKNLAIFIPAVGGLKGISINDRSYPVSMDYSSVGPVFELPQGTSSYVIKVHIQAPLTDFTGIWKSAPQVGELSALLQAQRHVELVQIYTPIVEAAVAIVFSVLFVLFYVLLKRKIKAYRDFGIALTFWALFYFFLSGLPREVDFKWGSLLHYPAREIAVIGTFLMFLRLPTRKSVPIKAYLVFLFAITLVSFVLGVLRYPYEQRIVHVFASVVAFSVLFLYRFGSKDLTAKLLFIFGVVSAIGQVSDFIKLLEIFNYRYPLPFLNRWTTMPLLVVAFTDCIIQYASYFHQLRFHLFKANSYARVVLHSAKEGLSHDNVGYFLKIAGRICGYKRVSLAQRHHDGTYRVIKLHGSKSTSEGSLINHSKITEVQTAISEGEVVFGLVQNVRDSWKTPAFAVVPVPEERNPPYLLFLSDPKKSDLNPQEILPYLSQISSAIWTNFERTKEQDLNHFAAQIAHDIRSPLATLNTIVHTSGGVNESVRDQIKSVVARIRDIANNLLRPETRKLSVNLDDNSPNKIGQDSIIYEWSLEGGDVELIPQQISSIVTEKRLQLSNRNGVEIYFNENAMGLPFFANIQRVDFGRVLSNLIDNALEAVGESGKVKVNLKGDDNQIQISVEDDGVGMAPEILGKIGTRGYSFGKQGEQSGSGLGVYHAIETIKSWGGQLSYETEVSKGTKAIITLPRVKAPDWFAESIRITTNATVVVLDDDPSMLEVWRERFRSAGLDQVQVMWFATCRDLIQWYRETLCEVDHPLYLCDYELGGHDYKGLDVIEMLGIAREAILVTNRWDDEEIRRRCEKSKVKILPKAVNVSIECGEVYAG